MTDHTTLAREIAAAELARLHRSASDAAQRHRQDRLFASADVSTAAAGVFADLFRQLTGRHPGEVDS